MQRFLRVFETYQKPTSSIETNNYATYLCSTYYYCMRYSTTRVFGSNKQCLFGIRVEPFLKTQLRTYEQIIVNYYNSKYAMYVFQRDFSLLSLRASFSCFFLFSYTFTLNTRNTLPTAINIIYIYIYICFFRLYVYTHTHIYIYINIYI